ncbi:MAG: glycosyltransferase family 4 protein [Clostridia bacterium]|nr:glycosyltransferase family 4 protein [Clostridia bacterium]
MRILFISECYPDESKTQYGIFIRQQEEALQRLGHSVDVLVPECTGKNSAMQKNDNVYRITYKTVRYDVFPLLAAGSVYHSIDALIEKNQYDLVAVHIVGDGILKMAVKACNRHQVPVVVHYHGLNVWEEYVSKHPHRQKLYADRRFRILQHAQGIVGVSNKVCDIIKQRIKGIPVATVYNGVEPELFVKRTRDDSCFRVIGVGNLIEIKGFHILLDAFFQLHKEFPETHLDIVGDGVQRDALQAQVKSLGMVDAVTFYGKLPYDRVAEMMGQSDLFVLPSFYEALGCVYLEAMCSELPTVGVRGMGIDEIIVDGENGLLVDPKNSEQLYHKMSAVVKDADFAATLGQKGKETAQKFTWAASANSLIAFYQECMK